MIAMAMRHGLSFGEWWWLESCCGANLVRRLIELFDSVSA